MGSKSGYTCSQGRPVVGPIKIELKNGKKKRVDFFFIIFNTRIQG